MKQQVRTKLEGDWIADLEGNTRDEAIRYLQQLPENIVLEHDCYDYNSGLIYSVRDETDEEESTRELREAEEEAQRIANATAKERLEKMALEEKLERLKWEDSAIYAYLLLHKDNPNIKDMENLFRAKLGLERAGTGSVDAIKALNEALTKLEGEQ